MVKYTFLLLLATCCAPAWAAGISVKVDRNPVAPDENFRIIFTAEGSIDAEPDFSPLNKDFKLLGTSQSSQFKMINGAFSGSKSYTLTVVPLRRGKIAIPPIHFGRDKSPATTVTVMAAGGNQARSAPAGAVADKDIMFITGETDTEAPYVQQQVILKIKIYRSAQWAEAGLSDAKFQGVEARIQSLGKQTGYSARLKGKDYQVTELRYALFPQQSGKLTIAPFRVTAKFPAGAGQRRSPAAGGNPLFDNFFSRQTYREKTAQSNAISLQIKPIPPGFTGKHWLPAKDLKLRQHWAGDTGRLKVGEPVTRTLTLIGDGVGSSQLPDIIMQETGRLKNYPDQAVVNEQPAAGGLLSTRTQKFAVIPSQPGRYTTPAITVPWWNTVTDKPQVARIPAATLVTGGKVPPVVAQSAAAAITEAVGAAQPAGSQPGDTAAAINTVLLVAVIILAICWLLTLFILLKNTPSQTDRQKPRIIEHKAGKKAALKQLQLACRGNEAAAVRDALIRWARAQWPGNPPKNLEDIAGRLPAEPATQVAGLSVSLYGQHHRDWDAHIIWRAILRLPAADAGKPAATEVLEPLYRRHGWSLPGRSA